MLNDIFAVAMALAGIAAIAFSLWQRRKNASGLNRLFLSLGIFAIVTAFYILEPQVIRWIGVKDETKLESHLVDAIWWMSFGFLITKIIDFFLWRGMLTHEGELLVPRILVHLTNFLVYLIVFILFMYFGLEKDVSALVATSGAFIFAVGYLAKAPFESAFAGLALNLAPMFRKGDRVAIYPRDVAREFMGTVIDIGWMHVTIKNKEGHIEHIQNLLVEQSGVVNFSQPAQLPCYTTEVTLEYEVPLHQGHAAIQAALKDLSETIEKFVITANRFSRFGITYSIRFWVADKHNYLEVVHAINSAIYYKIQKAIRLDFGYDKFGSMNAAQVSDKLVTTHQAAGRALSLTKEQRSLELRKIEILASLTKDEIDTLAATCTPHIYGPPEMIIRQGDKGDSMFVVVEGKVRVYLKPEGHDSIELAINGPGKYFGEMALLTGQPRGAFVRALEEVVLLEIPKSGLSSILQNRPSLAGEIATAVADRQAQNDALLSAVSAKNKVEPHNHTLAEAIRVKVHHFFGLDKSGGQKH